MVKRLPENDTWRERFKQRIESKRSSMRNGGSLRAVWKMRDLAKMLEEGVPF
jgi:hypothetical protein